MNRDAARTEQTGPMECQGSQCAQLLTEWLQGLALGGSGANPVIAPATIRQVGLFKAAPYQEDAPAIRSLSELEGAIEHLEYSIFRRYENVLTRAERARLDNTIDNALFKAERFVKTLGDAECEDARGRCQALREAVIAGREKAERMRSQARRADLKLAQLSNLTPEGFEEFVAEVFEAMGYEVERVGGSGDEGADLKVKKGGLLGIVQCKYHTRGVVGSPELQKFLGTISHTRSHKGFFVTTRTFSLAAEKFVATHPIELIDGPRLVELVQDAMGPGAKREPEPAWF